MNNFQICNSEERAERYQYPAISDKSFVRFAMTGVHDYYESCEQASLMDGSGECGSFIWANSDYYVTKNIFQACIQFNADISTAVEVLRSWVRRHDENAKCHLDSVWFDSLLAFEVAQAYIKEYGDEGMYC